MNLQRSTCPTPSGTGTYAAGCFRLLINNRDPDQRGTVVNVPGLLVDLLADADELDPMRPYQTAGIPVIPCSAATGEGIDRLETELEAMLHQEGLTPVIVETSEFEKAGGSCFCMKTFLP